MRVLKIKFENWNFGKLNFANWNFGKFRKLFENGILNN